MFAVHWVPCEVAAVACTAPVLGLKGITATLESTAIPKVTIPAQTASDQ